MYNEEVTPLMQICSAPHVHGPQLAYGGRQWAFSTFSTNLFTSHLIPCVKISFL